MPVSSTGTIISPCCVLQPYKIIIIIIIINNNNKLDNKHWYDHVPKSVQTVHEDKVTILRNQQVRTTTHNKPVIIIRYNTRKKGTCRLLGVSIPGDKNVIKKEAEKI